LHHSNSDIGRLGCCCCVLRPNCGWSSFIYFYNICTKWDRQWWTILRDRTAPVCWWEEGGGPDRPPPLKANLLIISMEHHFSHTHTHTHHSILIRQLSLKIVVLLIKIWMSVVKLVFFWWEMMSFWPKSCCYCADCIEIGGGFPLSVTGYTAMIQTTPSCLILLY